MARPRKLNEKAIYIKPSLEEVLYRAQDYPVTFAGAPAGYGKTVLAAALSNIRKVTYFTVEEENQNEIKDKINKLAEDAQGISGEKIFISIDNVHDFKDRKYVYELYKMASAKESRLRFFLTSRINFWDIYSKEVIDGTVNLVYSEMFLLQSHDIFKYFDLCGIKIDVETADIIYNHTGGCINILFHIVKKYIATGKLIFTGEVPYYLYHTQLKYLTPDEETVGNRLAILGRFTLHQAELMMERIKNDRFLEHCEVSNMKETLDELCRKNYFIHYDSSAQEYEYNVFFIDEIMGIYKESYPEELEVMQGIVGDVHSEVGDFPQAAYYYYLCGDHDSMFWAIAQDNFISIDRDNREHYIMYFKDSSRIVRCRHHMAVLYLAWRFFNYGEIQLYKEASLEFLENLYGDKNLEEDKRQSLLCDYYLFKAMTEYENLDKVLEHYENALAVFDGKPRSYHTVVPRTFGSPSIMRIIYNSGTMNRLNERINSIADLGNILTGNRWKGYDTTAAAEVAFLNLDLEEAKILIYKAYRECVESGYSHGGNRIALAFLNAQIALMEGDATTIRREFIDNVLQEDIKINSQLCRTDEMCRAWIYVQLDMAERAEPWIKTGNFSSLRFLYPAMPSVYLVYIYVQLGLGKYARVLSYHDYFFEGKGGDNLIIRQEACMIFAAAASEMGKVIVAKNYLEEALMLATQTKNHATLVLYGDKIMPMLTDVPDKYAELASIMKKKIKEFIAQRKKIRKQLEIFRFMGLTERELQVAICVSQGHINKEIAKELSISENTVKSTLKRIFSKLNITSRRQITELIRKHEL